MYCHLLTILVSLKRTDFIHPLKIIKTTLC